MDENRQDERSLSSWKGIADFLGFSERTAQKYEAERGSQSTACREPGGA